MSGERGEWGAHGEGALTPKQFNAMIKDLGLKMENDLVDEGMPREEAHKAVWNAWGEYCQDLSKVLCDGPTLGL